MKPLSRLLAASCIGLLRDGLSHPSSQANDACKCNGWKNPNPPTAPRMDLQQPVTNLSEPCRSCSHALGNPPRAAPLLGPPGWGAVPAPRLTVCCLCHSRPRVPPGERLGGGDQPTAGHGGGRGEPLHVSAQGGGHGHQAGLFLPVQGASICPAAHPLPDLQAAALCAAPFQSCRAAVSDLPGREVSGE